MAGRGGRGGRRSRGRPGRNRAHSRPSTAATPAAASADRVSAIIERFMSEGARVAEMADVLGVRGIDIARWRRGQPIARYRREEIEARLGQLSWVEDHSRPGMFRL